MMEGTEAIRRETKGVLVWLPVSESWRSRERQTEVLCVLMSESANKINSEVIPTLTLRSNL